MEARFGILNFMVRDGTAFGPELKAGEIAPDILARTLDREPFRGLAGG